MGLNKVCLSNKIYQASQDRVAELFGGGECLLDVADDERGRHLLPDLGDPLGEELPVLRVDDGLDGRAQDLYAVPKILPCAKEGLENGER